MRLERVIVAVLVIALGACTSGEEGDATKRPGRDNNPSPAANGLIFADPDLPVTQPEGVVVEDYVGGLDFAVDMAWDGKETFFITQKSGAIRSSLEGSCCLSLARRSP